MLSNARIGIALRQGSEDYRYYIASNGADIAREMDTI
jgi:hypothetical protein